MAEHDSDDDVTPAITRRSFFTRAGLSALGTGSVLEAALACTPEQQQAAPAPAPVRGVGPEPVPVELVVNGRRRSLTLAPSTTLVQALREGFGLRGTKVGCDRGACSACTVWVDGEVVASCMTFALDVRGRAITTIEGLSRNDELHPVQQAFIDYDALQCGFCTPGMVMSCAALIDRQAGVGLEDVKTAVSGHLCRCGTYPNVIKATLAAAARKRTGSSHG